MGKELRNTEWILANVSLCLLPPSLPLDFYPFLPPARYIFLMWSTFREICFFRCTVFLDLVRSSSIFDVATLPSRRNCSRLFAGCKWLESSTPLQYFSNFSFFFRQIRRREFFYGDIRNTLSLEQRNNAPCQIFPIFVLQIFPSV